MSVADECCLWPATLAFDDRAVLRAHRYVLNVVYNDTNKQVLKVLDLPWTLSALQLGLGLLYIVPLWLVGVRKTPKLKSSDLSNMLPISIIHALGQCVTVAALGAGSLAFVNVVKSLEPFCNVVFAALIMGDVLPWQVNICLLPVVAGVAIASAADMSFTWDTFAYSMGSNLCFSARSICAKLLRSSLGKSMDNANLFVHVNAYGAMMLLPFVLYFEGPVLLTILKNGGNPAKLFVMNGIFYYLNNHDH